MRHALAVLALLAATCALAQPPLSLPEWMLSSVDGRARAGERFEIVITGPAHQALPDRIDARLKHEAEERIVPLEALTPPGGPQVYSGIMPAGFRGAVGIDLPGRSSSVLVLRVAPRVDPVQTLTGTRDEEDYEPPLSENDPMYFVLGARGGYTSRFQLSFKYRLFDRSSGFGRDQPLLSALYFGYTQNSLWDLSSESKAFRDTSYRPSLFWRWERADEKTWIDGGRLGLEHESNGRDGPRSRSINILFLRPEWRWQLGQDRRFEFTPKLYSYLEREENPDIQRYRGHVDWRLRYDAAGEWITTGVLRVGTSGKGSVLLDVSRRARDLRLGPVGGYFHVQYFRGYGEDILDYNVRRPSQLRIGVAIVP